MTARSEWTRREVEAIVDDYFYMLTQELAGQHYSKASHRGALLPRLDGRSNGSVEFKHQNISAVLVSLGCPYIAGYKPRWNYQDLLSEVVEDRVTSNQLFNQTALSASEQPAVVPMPAQFEQLMVRPPTLRHRVDEPSTQYRARSSGVFRDYLDRESRNRSLGLAGEEFIVNFERERLRRLGRPLLSDRVEHVAQTKGDGLGFDILSFEEDGRERFVEVKTTAFGKETPFFVTSNEVEFSERFSGQFHLYRLFEFRKAPRLFDLEGQIRKQCILDAVSFRASFV